MPTLNSHQIRSHFETNTAILKLLAFGSPRIPVEETKKKGPKSISYWGKMHSEMFRMTSD